MTMQLPNVLSSAVVAAALLAATSGGAAAESYPAKPIRIISPFSAGSPPDSFGRLIAQQLSARLGQNVLIENRPGAGTTIGIKAASAADPDGYTLVQVNAALSYAPVLYSNAGFDPIKSFTPVAFLATWTHVLVAHPSVEAGSIKDLIAYAKTNPGKVNIGSPFGNPPHVLAEMLRMESHADFNDIPYRQNPQLVADLLAGRLQLYFGAGEPIVSMVREGRLKAYAVTRATRDPALPNVPTMAEAGLGKLTVSPSDWTGLLAPAGTPSAVVAKLNAALNDVLTSQETQAMLTKLGWEARMGTPQEFGAFVAADIEKWTPIVKAAGLKAD